ncbi:unnamed protein product [Leptidea sinapis]|uniref:BTB domain-containing protein n=1 Tax=Leptidea sinapis TaxID=189913 RepID=A0A5E4PNL7_9NEOP|nr:unnamed protein product [Leptidea sinapis]
MEKSVVKTLVDGLKSTSSSRIQDSLWKIKTSVISTSKGTEHFFDCGGLELLLPHLRKTNEKILDMTLSILGNLCLDEKCCLAVGNLNNFAQLVDILNTVCKDSILGRTCKLIGNLALKQLNAEGLHSHGVVKSLVTVIESRDKNTSNPTLTMAVRAIRQLWMITNKRDEMLGFNVVHCVTLLLISLCESIGLITSLCKSIPEGGPTRSQEELISGDGRGFQCLVALTKTNETLALKCLMNLCYQPTCRPLLGTAGLVECLVALLKQLAFQILIGEGLITLLTEKLTIYTSTMENCHTVIHTDDETKENSSGHECIPRNKEKDEGDSKINNIEAGDVSKVVIERDSIIIGFGDALSSDKSDESDNDSIISRPQGVKRGRSSPINFKKKPKIIKIAKNEWSAGVYWELRRAKSSPSQSPRIISPDRNDVGQLSPYSDGNWSACSPEYRYPKGPRWDWSPESEISADSGSTSPYQVDNAWSPSSSNPASPLSTEDNSSDSDISGRYSPVCSEADSDTEETSHSASNVTPGLNANQVANDLEELIMEDESDDEEIPTEDNKQIVVTESTAIMCVIVLLYRISHSTSTAGNTEENTNNLDLLSGRECINSLLDYVEKCKRPLGRAARIVSKILRSTNILKRYFIDCKALHMLFSMISDTEETMKNYVIALVKLASNVQIKDPKLLEKRFKEYVVVSYDAILDNLLQEDIVIFNLDDNTTVTANKSFLCQHSEVFNVMLTGGFKESTERCVTLKNATKTGLEYLFTLLQFGLNNSTCELEIFPLAENLETNLEVLVLADRFLFDKLKGLLSSAIIQFLLKPETADKVYIWSLGDGMGFLCVEAVAYLLKGDMTDDERVASFKNILELEYKEHY